MRIGIDYTAAVRQGAGIGRYTRGLVRALAEIDRENRYILFSAGRDPQGGWPSNYSTRSVPLTDRQLSIVWQRLRLPIPIELVTGRVDILHSPDFVLPPTLARHTVLTVHDLSYMRYPECSSAPLLAYLMDAVPRSVARAEVILADSHSTRRDLGDLLHVPAERVVVLYAGVEPRFVPQEDATVASVLAKYDLRQPFILGLGTLQPRKNFARLIRAYYQMREEHGVLHQLVIGGGRGWLYEDIDATITELGLADQVRLIGYVQDDDLPGLYAAADLFAFPSLYEGFGIPILEAMGCGTPVVAANSSSLPEVAGDAAVLVDPEDVDALAEALWRVITDAELRQTLVSRGHEQVRRFSWRASAEQLLGVYRSLGST